jgi:hypothetical protein
MSGKRAGRVLAAVLGVLAAVGGIPAAGRAQPAAIPAGAPYDRTPPRLSFVDGQASFWRPGAEEWVAAQVNTPLAPGDELYTGPTGNLEIQIGARAYVRAWGGTHIGLATLEPDYLQVTVRAGNASLDLRRLDAGHTVEVATPNAAFTIEHAGYYRLSVTEGRTSFITRRGGRATVTTASGVAASIAPSEEVVVQGTDSPHTATYVAPPLDDWDRWNYTRTDQLIDAVSARYVSPGVYGVDDLDHYGSWRVVQTYGPVWVPAGVPVGWAPYSTGSWVWDPFFGWTWVDTAPWGWAPYHHGRWVFVDTFWAWAPGPIVVQPVYAPALVAFFGPRVGIGIGFGPAVGWVALGWGEPIVPWWGPAGFVGVPWWGGWGGPRIVNHVVISHTTVVHVHDIHTYRNADVRHAVVAVPRERFGRDVVPRARIAQVDVRQLEPLRTGIEVAPARASLAPGAVRGVRPPETALGRAVVATRPPEDPGRWLRPQGIPEVSAGPARPARVVSAPVRRDETTPAPRPPFGASQVERSRPPLPPVAPRPQVGAGAERVAPSAAGPALTPRSQPRPAVPSPRVEPRAGVAVPPSSPTPGVETRPAAPLRDRVQPSGPAASAPAVRPGVSAPSPAPRPVTPPQARVQPPGPAASAPAIKPGVSVSPRATPAPRPAVPQPSAVRPAPRPEMRTLPGEPANRLYPGRVGTAPGQSMRPSIAVPARGPATPSSAGGRLQREMPSQRPPGR